MSKNYSNCDIVLELLPYYLDGKTCEESNAFVKEHLAGCKECRQVHELMSADLLPDERVTPGKTKKKHGGKWKRLTPTKKKIAILVVGLVGYLILMMGVVVYAIWLLICV